MPAPFAPTNPVILPPSTPKLTSSSTRRSPKLREIPEISIILPLSLLQGYGGGSARRLPHPTESGGTAQARCRHGAGTAQAQRRHHAGAAAVRPPGAIARRYRGATARRFPRQTEAAPRANAYA
ncbi:hypothetical protein GCM10020360_25580 [Nonlabens tegetincola]